MEVTPVTEKTNPSKPETSPAVDALLVAELVKRAQDGGLPVSGEGGLLQQLTKIVLESSLEGEMDAHLGYSKHDPQGRNGENSRNGSSGPGVRDRCRAPMCRTIRTRGRRAGLVPVA
jgi:putative transposase